MSRRIPAIALIIALSFQALFVVPAAIAACCCETEAVTTSSDECGQHADKSDHRCPCCDGGMALACGNACAALALPILSVSVSASLTHDSFTPATTRAPSSQDYTPLKPPPIA